MLLSEWMGLRRMTLKWRKGYWYLCNYHGQILKVSEHKTARGRTLEELCNNVKGRKLICDFSAEEHRAPNPLSNDLS